VLAQTTLAAYLFVFMAWLFFVSKPSFMSVLPWGDKIAIGMLTALPVLAVVLGAYAGCALFFVVTVGAGLHRDNRVVLLLPLAAILLCLSVLMLDNFTYTVVGWGIIRTSGLITLLYLLLVAVLFVKLIQSLSRVCFELSETASLGFSVVALSLLAGSLLLMLMRMPGNVSSTSDVVDDQRSRPNILLFASDGIEASWISGYGYEKTTTPHLDQLMSDSLVFAAAFSNGSRTSGSTVSMLTGQYPTTTRMMFPPQTLLGADAYQHLPGMLRDAGYRLFQETMRYYADAPDLNMRHSFHVANRREIPDQDSRWLPESWLTDFSDIDHFFSVLLARVSDRALHLVGNASMQDGYSAVDPRGVAKVYGFSDRGRIDAALEFIRTENGPFFAQIHLMETHCCRYDPPLRKFSAHHKAQTRDNADDFFLDAVLASDLYFGELLEALEEAGKLANTLIVYSSDHTRGWGVDAAVPLVMRFPEAPDAAVITSNVQLLDVAPTILDYLDLNIPAWMEGRSLLDNGLDPMRPIFTVSGVNRKRLKTATDRISQLRGSGPPLYGLEGMTMLVCQRWYTLALPDGELSSGVVKGHPQPCTDAEFPTPQRARQALLSHLTERGFQVAVSH
jgi:arylsulfatase A-like enzyme